MHLKSKIQNTPENEKEFMDNILNDLELDVDSHVQKKIRVQKPELHSLQPNYEDDFAENDMNEIPIQPFNVNAFLAESNKVSKEEISLPESTLAEPDQVNELPSEPCVINPEPDAVSIPVQVNSIKTYSVGSSSKSVKNQKSFLPKFEIKKEVAIKPTQTENTCTNDSDLHPLIKITSQTSQDLSLFENKISAFQCMKDENDSVQVYWFDAFEKSGIVYVFGKVRRI